MMTAELLPALHNQVVVQVARLIDDSVDVDRAALATDPLCFTDPVIIAGEVRDRAYGMRRRVLLSRSESSNLRVTMGRDQWQRVLMSGDLGSGSLNGLVVAYTGTTVNTLTGASALPTAVDSAGNTGLQGKLLIAPNATPANTVVGVIVSNTATAITVDQWYAIPVTGGVGTTPTNAAGTAYVLPGAAWAAWMGVCATGGTGTPPTGGHAPAAADVLRSADGLFGNGTTGAAATEQNASGLVRTYVAATFPLAGQIQYANTFTYTGAALVSVDVVVLCNSKPAVGSLLVLETVLNATASVNNNGDTIAVTWQVNL